MTARSARRLRGRASSAGVLIAVWVSMATGCGSAQSDAVELEPKSPGEIPTTEGVLEFTYADGHYNETLDDLRSAAELIVVVTPTGRVDEVEVEQPVAGDLPVPVVIVEYQVVQADGAPENLDTVWVAEPFLTDPLLLPRTDSYSLMYLYEYEYWQSDARPAGAPLVYTTAGILQGLWVDVVGDGREFTRTTTDVAMLPEFVTFEQATR